MTPDWTPSLPPARTVELADRGRLTVREVAGPPGAPAMILIHGWTVTSDLNWFPVFDALGEHFRVVAFDNRGHGRGIRSQQRFRLDDCADDVVAVADALGLERFVVAGYSMGGNIATLVWRRHRQRVLGLVLGASAPTFADSARLAAQFAVFRPAARLARCLPQRVCRPVYDRLIWQRTRDRDLQQWIIDEIRSGDPVPVLEAGSEIGRFDSRGWLTEVDVPASVLIAEHDTIVAPWRQERLAAALADVEVWRLAGDHDVCVRRPRRFAAAMTEACLSVARRAGVAPTTARGATEDPAIGAPGAGTRR